MKKELRHQIWDLLEQKPNLKTGEIAKILDYDVRQISTAISTMVKGINLLRHGNHGFYTYTVISRPISKRKNRDESKITTKQRIYSDVYYWPDTTPREVSIRLNVAFNTIRECMREMAVAGHLEVTGVNKTNSRLYQTVETDEYSLLDAPRSTDDVVNDIQSRGTGVWAVMAAQLIKE